MTPRTLREELRRMNREQLTAVAENWGISDPAGRLTGSRDDPAPPVTFGQCESAEFAAVAQGVHSVSIVLVDNTADRAH